MPQPQGQKFPPYCQSLVYDWIHLGKKLGVKGGFRGGIGGANTVKYKQIYLNYDMELLVSELYLLVAAICGGITVIIYSRGRFGNTEINTKLKNRYNEYISQLETENKKTQRTS